MGQNFQLIVRTFPDDDPHEWGKLCVVSVTGRTATVTHGDAYAVKKTVPLRDDLRHLLSSLCCPLGPLGPFPSRLPFADLPLEKQRVVAAMHGLGALRVWDLHPLPEEKVARAQMASGLSPGSKQPWLQAAFDQVARQNAMFGRVEARFVRPSWLRNVVGGAKVFAIALGLLGASGVILLAHKVRKL